MQNFLLSLPIILTLLVVVVNGFTDAPNAIATAVCTGAIGLKSACLLCGAFNFVGCLSFSLLSGQVIDTVFSIISPKNEVEAYICITSALLTTIVFAITAWLFKMPTSESHALICGLIGASLFFGEKSKLSSQGIYIIICMCVSCLLAFLLSLTLGKIKFEAQKKHLIFSLCSCSLMHGAQDGQKFVGALMFLGGFMNTSATVFAKAPLCILVSFFMLSGSLLGGKRIIDTLGNKTSKLNFSGAFFSDISSIFTVLFCSLLGLPVSTGNIRTFSIIGAGVSINQPINKKTAGSVLLISVLTLPVCFIMGYFICYLLLPIRALI